MTERPKTMMLSPHEWRALVGTTANNIYSYVSQVEYQRPPNTNEVAWINDTIDRLQMQVSAWAASGQPVAQIEKERLNEAYRETDLAMRQAIGNGTGTSGLSTAMANVAKKKRGWQKGRKRGPRKPKGNEAVQ